jgi:hypothetical protein
VKQAAHALSILMHPVFMPLITVWLALRVDPHLGYFLTDDARLLTLGIVAIMTAIFPLASTLLLLRAGVIRSLEMPLREERIAPYLMTLIYYGMAWYLLDRSPLHRSLAGLFSGAFLALAITTVITFRWKISAHMVGIGGLLGALAGLSAVHGLHLLPLLGAFILGAGLLGTARLINGTHSPAQVYAGAALGFACTFLAVTKGPAWPS